MTNFEIAKVDFSSPAVADWAKSSPRNVNWPVVYVLDDLAAVKLRPKDLHQVYVGESLHAAGRFRQHISSPDKKSLSTIRVIVNETFNKSACLDLESYLIRMLAGDGAFRVLNRNDGVTESDYYDRARYRETFREVFDQLSQDGVFTRTIPQIENSDLFKLSPFKALTQDQAIAVEDILEGLLADLSTNAESPIVIQGEPGTGKTVVAIYLIKLLADIAASRDLDDLDSDSLFSEFFIEDNRNALVGLRVGLVVPQQSLRKSIERVFAKTPGLESVPVMTPFDVGESEHPFDLLIVDEAHRLNQRANQPSASQNKRFKSITTSLFGSDDFTKTQLDWIIRMSRHQILLVDAAQRVRPADLPSRTLHSLVDTAKNKHRHYPLVTQLRVEAGADYIGYVRRMLGVGDKYSTAPPVLGLNSFAGYDFRLFDDLAEMSALVRQRNEESGLSRLLAGYAWKWKSKADKAAFDIEIDGLNLRWNSTQVDWIASAKSIDEVGSIHTVQGYDLNYAGVIIGPDLRFDAETGRLWVDRKSYFDTKGKESNTFTGTTSSDADLLEFIGNIYSVLLTRGIRGTYVYVCDPALREYLRSYIPAA
jgi:DUF2075 family protein